MQAQVLAEGRRAKVEVLGHELLDLLDRDRLGPEGVDHHRDRVGDADGVGNLHLGAVGEAGGDDVLGHVAGGVGGRAVDLRRVLSGEGATAMPGHAAVGVDDDLAAGEAAVTNRAPDHEASGRVDQEVGAELVGVVLHSFVVQDRYHDLLPKVVGNLLLLELLAVDILVVLGGDQNPLDGDRPVVHVADAHLRLAVGTKVGERAVLADLGKALGQAMGKVHREGHQRLGLAGGVPKHHPLVAGPGLVERVLVALAGLLGLVDALGDIRRLCLEPVEHLDRVGVEHRVESDVTDLADLVADDLLHVDLRDVERGLPGDNDEVVVDQRLAGDLGEGVLGEDRVENRVGDLVGDLVGMALGDRFGGEEEAVLCAHMTRKRSGPLTVGGNPRCTPSGPDKCDARCAP